VKTVFWKSSFFTDTARSAPPLSTSRVLRNALPKRRFLRYEHLLVAKTPPVLRYGNHEPQKSPLSGLPPFEITRQRSTMGLLGGNHSLHRGSDTTASNASSVSVVWSTFSMRRPGKTPISRSAAMAPEMLPRAIAVSDMRLRRCHRSRELINSTWNGLRPIRKTFPRLGLLIPMFRSTWRAPPTDAAHIVVKAREVPIGARGPSHRDERRGRRKPPPRQCQERRSMGR